MFNAARRCPPLSGKEAHSLLISDRNSESEPLHSIPLEERDPDPVAPFDRAVLSKQPLIMGVAIGNLEPPPSACPILLLNLFALPSDRYRGCCIFVAENRQC